MKFFNQTLSNGLTVIGEQRKSAVSTALGFFARTGARDETPELAGVSHFLEHMMFKGTASRSALDITYQMGAIGAQANAYTSEEVTVYYMGVLPEFTETAFELLSDMLRPSLSQEEFDVEKNVILEEIALYQDRPNFLVFESAMREFFANHPAGNSVLGSVESVSALTREQMQNYFDERYSPSNLVLAVSGNFDWDKILELAERHCSAWKQIETNRQVEKHIAKSKEVKLTKEGINRAHLCLVAPGPAATDELRYEAAVLANILGDSSGSKAYWSLVDPGLADSASIGTDAMDACGMMYAYAGFEPERFEQVNQILRDTLRDSLDFTEKDLLRAKTKIRTRLVLQGESSMRRLMAIGNDWLAREKHQPLEGEQERFKEVTSDSIKNLVGQFDFSPLTEVCLLPK